MDFGDLSDSRLILELSKKYVTVVGTVEWDKVLGEFMEATGHDKITASEIIVDFMKENGDSA